MECLCFNFTDRSIDELTTLIIYNDLNRQQVEKMINDAVHAEYERWNMELEKNVNPST